MKKIFAAMFITASFAFASAQTISFDKTTVDYGTVKNGADGNRVFVVKNTGDKPLEKQDRSRFITTLKLEGLSRS